MILVAIAMMASLFAAPSAFAQDSETAPVVIPDGYELASCATIEDQTGANDVFTCEGIFYADSDGIALVDSDGEPVRPEITGQPEFYLATAPCTLGHTYTMDQSGTWAPTQWGCVGGGGPSAPLSQCIYTADLAGCDDFGSDIDSEHYNTKRNWAAVKADNPANGGLGLFGGGINPGAVVIVDGEVVSGNIRNGLPF